MNQLAAIVLAFLSDDRTTLLLALIALDLITGVMAALHTGVFQWQRVADFYRTSVVPGLLGYGTVYAIGALGMARFPEIAGVVALLTQWAGAGLLVAALVASIGANITQLAPPGARP